MIDKMKPRDTIIDFITGKEIQNIGSEENRQAVERYLIEKKGYQKHDIEVDVPIEIKIQDEIYRSVVDLVVSVDGDRFMAVECAAGSLESWSREIVSASRLLHHYQLPRSIVSDGKTAIVLDTLSGKKIQEGMQAIPARNEARDIIGKYEFQGVPKDRMEREKLIFRSYDMMKINVRWRISADK